MRPRRTHRPCRPAAAWEWITETHSGSGRTKQAPGRAFPGAFFRHRSPRGPVRGCWTVLPQATPPPPRARRQSVGAAIRLRLRKTPWRHVRTLPCAATIRRNRLKEPWTGKAMARLANDERRGKRAVRRRILLRQALQSVCHLMDGYGAARYASVSQNAGAIGNRGMNQASIWRISAYLMGARRAPDGAGPIRRQM